ncbi:hypothetical protein W02_10670 [Nitrospira sp. KM1]|uniref:MCP four helix bundle domain-containing protein n=1 Tax=Nitrospira sp. KM1 TaxID=1936990 RepID=UPI0013A7118D|nr:MCP four helix bundle domain-containing protein [Nitrospira sp. KM1]BCA53927.1 hypothetical protein W02_10670 [Nitrospira sp. KM1]
MNLRARFLWMHVLVSLLIIGCGLVGSRVLNRVDQNLRVMYAEYTLAVTDLSYINGELVRYRTSVIRAVQTDTQGEFRRIVDSLAQKRSRIDTALERFIRVSNRASSEQNIDNRELEEVKAVQAKLEEYMASSERTIQIMEKVWQSGSEGRAVEWRDEAERNMAIESGMKFVSVTNELERLIEVVAEIAGRVRRDADNSLRVTITLFIGVSFVLAVGIWCLPRH